MNLQEFCSKCLPAGFGGVQGRLETNELALRCPRPPPWSVRLRAARQGLASRAHRCPRLRPQQAALPVAQLYSVRAGRAGRSGRWVDLEQERYPPSPHPASPHPCFLPLPPTPGARRALMQTSLAGSPLSKRSLSPVGALSQGRRWGGAPRGSASSLHLSCSRCVPSHHRDRHTVGGK